MRFIGLTLSGVLVLAMSSSAYAQTLMEKIECTGDAMRLCREYVPNHKMVENCMEIKHDQLSAGCMRVFDAGLAELRREGGQVQ